jgi:hypothetical protein
MSKKTKIIGFLIGVILLLLFTLIYVFYGGSRNIASEETKFVKTSKVITAEFTADVAKATLKYSDKTIAVSGKVTAVSDSIVTIDNTIICNFNLPDATIKTDQLVSIKGRLVGFDDLMGELKLDQCSINKNN